MAQRKKAVVVGAGLAGFAVATELVDHGYDVEMFEANTYLGGRASDLVDHKMHDPVPIGPHVFCQWYDNFFRMMRKVGAEKAIEWERQTLVELVHDTQHHSLKFHKLPAPLFTLPWLIQFPWMSLSDKLSNFKMIRELYTSSEEHIEALDGMHARDFLENRGVTQDAIETFWQFITLSLLNVSLEECSAAEFALLVRKWAHLKRRKFGFPKVGLGDIYADEAEKYVCRNGGAVHRKHSVTHIEQSNGRVDALRVTSPLGSRVVRGDVFVSTLYPGQLVKLLPDELKTHEFFLPLADFHSVPYISVNMWFDKKISHKQFWAMLSHSGKREYLNTDFYDFSNIYKTKVNKGGSYIASNIINSGNHASLADTEIVARTLAELQEAFPTMNATLIHSHVHRIPHVVCAPRPGSRALKRGPNTPISNFFLAGDWTIRELPQCMEAAVKSGYKCAEAVLKQDGKEVTICIDNVL